MTLRQDLRPSAVLDQPASPRTQAAGPHKGRRKARRVYCFVELKIPRQTPSFVPPSEARNGLQVAVVEDGKGEIAR
jgi:hypothetical protein